MAAPAVRVPLALGLVLLAALALPDGTHAASFHEFTQLTASDAEPADLFGSSIAVSGDTAVVGARAEDEGGAQAGAVYVYQRDEGGSGNWGEVKKLIASDAQAGDVFGWKVAISGDIVVVGANDAGASLAGAAYVFQRDEGGADNWGEVKKLTAFDADAGDLYGTGVAVSGDIVVVGAAREDAGGQDAGAAYVFQRDQGSPDNWGEVQKLTASDAQAGYLLGDSVAVSGDTAIVGADGEGGTAGAAYVFQRDEGGADNWGEVKKLTAFDADAGDLYGTSVAVSGETAIVGSWLEDTEGANAGAVYVYQRNAGGSDNWGDVKKLTASDAQAIDLFGFGLDIRGDTVIVGALREDAKGENAGAAYVFQRDKGGADNWGELKKLTASDAQTNDNFGYSVAVGGDTAFVGAWLQDAEADAAGAVYMFDLLQPKPTPTPTKQPEPGDTDGDGCSDVRENGPDETLGGLRDYKNPYDFYDVLGPEAALPADGVIDLPNDILGVILHFSPQGQPPTTCSSTEGSAAAPMLGT